MITVQQEAISALSGLKWTRGKIKEAMNVSTSEIQVVLGKDPRGWKSKAAKLDGRTKAGRAARAKK